MGKTPKWQTGASWPYFTPSFFQNLPQMRRTASSHASLARHLVKIPGTLRANLSGTMVRRTALWMGEAMVEAAAARQSYKHRIRGKRRPDSSRRPTGLSLMNEKECKGPRPFLNPSHSLSFPSSSPLTLLTAIIPKQEDFVLFLELTMIMMWGGF